MQQSLLVDFGEIFGNLYESMGFVQGNWQNYVMLLISFVLMYLAVVKKFEPMFLINIPGAEAVLWGTHPVDPVTGVADMSYDATENRGLLWYLYFGVDKVIYPPLIFLGIGCMTVNSGGKIYSDDSDCGIFVYGADTYNSETAYARAYHKKRASDKNETSSSGKQAREDFVPADSYARCRYNFTSVDIASRYANAG